MHPEPQVAPPQFDPQVTAPHPEVQDGLAHADPQVELPQSAPQVTPPHPVVQNGEAQALPQVFVHAPAHVALLQVVVHEAFEHAAVQVL